MILAEYTLLLGVASADPWWLNASVAAQAVITGAIALLAGIYAYNRFWHRNARHPRVHMTVGGRLVQLSTNGTHTAIISVALKNDGDVSFSVVSDFTRVHAAQSIDGYSGIQVFVLQLSDIESFSLSNALTFDHNEWRYGERLDGQWKVPKRSWPVLGPGETETFSFAVPLPREVELAYVSLLLGVLRGRRKRPEKIPALTDDEVFETGRILYQQAGETTTSGS